MGNSTSGAIAPTAATGEPVHIDLAASATLQIVGETLCEAAQVSAGGPHAGVSPEAITRGP